MAAMLRGAITLPTEHSVQTQFLSRDGAVSLIVYGLDPLPRTGETVELGEGALFVVEHVRWSFRPGGGLLPGTAYARILVSPTTDPYGSDLR